MARTTARQNPRAWLPDTAIRALDIDRVLSDLTRAWSARWFASRAVRPLDPLSGGTAPTGYGGECLMLDRELAVCLSADARTLLSGAMLNLDVPGDGRSEADDRLLDDLTQACLDDLCRRLAETFRLDTGARWERFTVDTVPVLEAPQVCAVGVDSDAPMLRMLVARDMLVGLAKAHLPPRGKPMPLAGIASGLAAQSVTVSATIGRCPLTLADVAGLGVGDVLIFDRALDAPVDLVVDGTDRPLARCTIARTDDRFDLTLLESIGG